MFFTFPGGTIYWIESVDEPEKIEALLSPQTLYLLDSIIRETEREAARRDYELHINYYFDLVNTSLCTFSPSKNVRLCFYGYGHCSKMSSIIGIDDDLDEIKNRLCQKIENLKKGESNCDTTEFQFRQASLLEVAKILKEIIMPPKIENIETSNDK